LHQSMGTYSGNPHRETTKIRRLIDNMKKSIVSRPLIYLN
jgi:hypothetical protein